LSNRDKKGIGMTTFGDAITTAHAAVITRQEHALQEHLRVHGTSQLESFSSALILRRQFPKVADFQFNRIVEQARKRRTE
jgi:hypothetical protein